MMIKRVLLAGAVLLSALTVIPHADAAPKSVSCKASTAVGHTPMKLEIPKIKKPFKNKTFKFKTNCGEIVVAADGVKAPLTVISLAYLANSNYYDNSVCHRLITSGIFILQCGDPTASGSGGPQWQVPDENLPTGSPTSNLYPAGTVAMANSGPNTNGSQFFFVFKDNSQLAASYTVWGKVIKGMEIINYIASKGSDATKADSPNQAFEIIKASAR
ncbi:MAG: hypothetical protein RL129_412 [Actinomycetota bacterium]|jgi:peptidyl-prolyl cis-trans isomerase B (cyclophilin B)